MFLDRNQFGATPSLRYGKDQPVSGSFSFYFRDPVDSTSPLLEQFILSGFPTGWVSTLGSTAEVKTCTVVWTIESTNHGDSADHTITLNHCTVSGSIKEGDPNMCTLNFVAHDLYPTVA